MQTLFACESIFEQEVMFWRFHVCFESVFTFFGGQCVQHSLRQFRYPSDAVLTHSSLIVINYSDKTVSAPTLRQLDGNLSSMQLSEEEGLITDKDEDKLNIS